MKSMIIDERQVKWLLSGLDSNQKHAHQKGKSNHIKNSN